MAFMLNFTPRLKSTILSGIIFFILSSPTWPSSSQQINFAEAVNLALNANPRISASKAKIDSAEASIVETRGNGLPKLNLEATGSRSNNPLTVFGDKLSQGKVSFADFGAAQYNGPSSLNTVPTALNSPGYYNNFNTGVVINIPLFSGGETLAKIKSAESLLKAAQHGDQEAKTELTYDVLQAYEGVRVTTELVLIAQKALKSAEEYLHLTNALNQQTIVTQSDVILAEINRRSAKTTLTAAIIERNNQLDAFHILIGQPESNLVPGTPVYLSLPKESLDDLEKHALQFNSQLLSLKSRVNAYHAEISSANAHNWPHVNLQLRHDWNAKTPAISGSSNTAMLVMNWELFSSGERYGAKKHAVAEYKQSVAELESALNNIRLSTIQTIRAIQTAETQLKSNEHNTHQSIEAVHLLKKRYGQGVINLGQLLDGQSRLDTARAQKSMARYNMILAQARLLMLLNKLNPTYGNCGL